MLSQPSSTPRKRGRQVRKTDIDLTGGFRLDLKTGLVLLALAFQWWDGREQANRQAAIQEIQNRSTTDALTELKRLTTTQQYSIETIRVAMAENGIKVK